LYIEQSLRDGFSERFRACFDVDAAKFVSFPIPWFHLDGFAYMVFETRESACLALVCTMDA
jgi:hypothetical protein